MRVFALLVLLSGAHVRAAAQSSTSTTETPPAASIDSLIRALSVLRGEFRFIDAERTGVYFTGDTRLFRALEKADTLAVPKLVECFSDTSPAAATVDGHPVQLGKICFHALTYTPYFQRRLRSATWMIGLKSLGLLPIRLTAPDSDLVRSQAWWRRYLAAGSPARP